MRNKQIKKNKTTNSQKPLHNIKTRKPTLVKLKEVNLITKRYGFAEWWQLLTLNTI